VRRGGGTRDNRPVGSLGLIAAALVGCYAAFVLLLLLAGRRVEARAVAGFVPDCVVLFRRLIADPAVPRRRKLVLAGMVVYLASPIDLVPDFLPGIGQLDDAILVALVLRYVLRAGGGGLLSEHWPGPANSLELLERLAGTATRRSARPRPAGDGRADA
jgi:uncharacterized membrane protein YkvA (DUF1232 family)